MCSLLLPSLLCLVRWGGERGESGDSHTWSTLFLVGPFSCYAKTLAGIADVEVAAFARALLLVCCLFYTYPSPLVVFRPPLPIFLKLSLRFAVLLAG